MSKSICALLLAGFGAVAFGQQASVTIEGKTISLKYPAATGGKALGESAPVAFHTDTDIVFKGFSVPKGDYTLFILPGAQTWQLVVSKAAGQKPRDAKQDVGRVPMTMGKPSAPVGACKVTLTKTAALAAKVEAACENATASASFHLDRVSEHSEW